MPPLLCPSPNIIDQSFPRTVDELNKVLTALERLTQGIHDQQFTVVLTAPIRQFISYDLFDWTKIAQYPKLHTIYQLIAQFGLQQFGTVRMDLSSVQQYMRHPVPKGCTAGLLLDVWAEEAGRLLEVHNRCCEQGRPFVGVACTNAFAGQAIGEYENPDNLPTFPLVGPSLVATLADYEEWDINGDVERISISFDDAKNRARLLGGRVTKPRNSSHYQVHFRGAPRPWPLDYNHTYVPEEYLKELIPLTALPLGVIKYVLKYGKWPKKKCKLADLAAASGTVAN